MSKILFLFFALVSMGCAHQNKQTALPEGPAMQSGYAPVNGLKMYYEIHGQGEPLILLHGGGSTIESNFSRFLPLLAKTRKIIAVEEQSHGHTANIARPFSFENTADDLAALLEFLKIEKADIFGFSNGGTTALHMAIRHPAKVRKIIVASGMYSRDGFPPAFWKMMATAKLADMPKPLQDADLKIHNDPKHLQSVFENDRLRMVNFKNIPEKAMKSIHAKTLVLSGDQDILIDHTVKMSRLLPNARLAILPTNHGGYLDEVFAAQGRKTRYPEATALIVNEFLSE